MPWTAEQRSIIDQRLPASSTRESADEVVQIRLKRRELRFVLDAIARYRDTECTEEEGNPTCEMSYWYEGAQGHIERGCERFCEELISRMLDQLAEKE